MGLPVVLFFSSITCGPVEAAGSQAPAPVEYEGQVAAGTVLG